MTRSPIVLLFALCCALPVAAQDEEEEKKLGWSNVADLGFVVTAGNSRSSSLSFDDKLTHAWKDAEFVVRAGALRIDTTDDPFAVGTPDDFEVIDDLIRELDTERYYVVGNYQRNITKRFFWIGGAGWDKDTNAGIENRTLFYGGVGNAWKETERTRFKTDYTVTFTKRVDEFPDPERPENFSELRLGWDYGQKIATHSEFTSDFVFFGRVSDFGDKRFVTLNSVTTNMTDMFAFRFSLEFRYQSIAAFEGIDLETHEGVPIGEVVIRKKKLDTVVKFSFVVTL